MPATRLEHGGGMRRHRNFLLRHHFHHIANHHGAMQLDSIDRQRGTRRDYRQLGAGVVFQGHENAERGRVRRCRPHPGIDYLQFGGGCIKGAGQQQYCAQGTQYISFHCSNLYNDTFRRIRFQRIESSMVFVFFNSKRRTLKYRSGSRQSGDQAGGARLRKLEYSGGLVMRYSGPAALSRSSR